MVDSVLLLVDAMDGPMPQTRFVTQKAFAMGFKPIVVINKVDRPGARPDWVLDQTFDLFDRLGATDEQLDFPIVYASALHGYAGLDRRRARRRHDSAVPSDHRRTCRRRTVDPDGPFQMRISQLDYSNYVGIIGIGRIQRGKVRTNMPVTRRSTAKARSATARCCRCSASWAWSAVEVDGSRGRRHRRDQRRRETSASPTPSARWTRPKRCRC